METFLKMLYVFRIIRGNYLLFCPKLFNFLMTTLMNAAAVYSVKSLYPKRNLNKSNVILYNLLNEYRLFQLTD